MNKAQIEKTQSEAASLRAQAGYVTGYQGRLAESNILSNETLNELRNTQTKMQEFDLNLSDFIFFKTKIAPAGETE